MIFASNPRSWHSELELQRERAWGFFQQVSDKNYVGSDRPVDQLERSIVLSCVALERLLREKVLEDRFSKRTITVDVFKVSGASLPVHGLELTLLSSARVTIQKVLQAIIGLEHGLLAVTGDEVVPSGMLIPLRGSAQGISFMLTIESFLEMTDVQYSIVRRP